MSRPKLPELPDPLELLRRFAPPALPNPFQRDEDKEAETTEATPVSSVTTQETIAYQNRELSKVLLALETHLSQGCRIAGKACDCCSGRHPLELEKLSEEALSMTSNEVYHDIIQFAREVDQKANVAALNSRQYDSEYPILAIRARNLRKHIMASGKAQAALEMIQRGELKIGDKHGS